MYEMCNFVIKVPLILKVVKKEHDDLELLTVLINNSILPISCLN